MTKDDMRDGIESRKIVLRLVSCHRRDMITRRYDYECSSMTMSELLTSPMIESPKNDTYDCIHISSRNDTSSKL